MFKSIANDQPPRPSLGGVQQIDHVAIGPESRDLVFSSKTSGALRLSLGYFNVEIPIQKVKFVFEDAVDEQFAELRTKIS